MVSVSVDVELHIFSCALSGVKEGPGEPCLWAGASNFCLFPTDSHLTPNSLSASLAERPWF